MKLIFTTRKRSLRRQVSVCPQGVCVSQHALGGVSVQGLSRVVGVCPGGCLPGRGHPPGGVCPGGSARGVWQTPPDQRQTPLPDWRQTPPPGPEADTPLPGTRGRHYGIRSTSGRYASHWNAFLFYVKTLKHSF